MGIPAALVLSGGGSRGLAHIGVVEALKAHGFEVHSVAGSSIGAVIGGLLAMGKLEEYTRWVSTLNKRDVWGFMDFTLTTHGLLKGEKVFDKMKSFIPDMNIEDMPLPFAAVATDIIHSREVVFTSGSFYRAIRASVAIPAVFTPVKYNDTILVDGCVLNPIPVNHVRRKPGDILVVVNLYGPASSSSASENTTEDKHDKGFKKLLGNLMNSGDRQSIGYFSLLTRSSAAMIQKIARMTIELSKPDLVIDIPQDSASLFEFYKASELIELGKTIASEKIREFHTMRAVPANP